MDDNALRTLRSDLQARMAHIESQIVSLLRQEYNCFQKAADAANGLERLVAEVQEPLNVLAAEIRTNRIDDEKSLVEFDQKIDSLRHGLAEQEHLEVLLDIQLKLEWLERHSFTDPEKCRNQRDLAPAQLEYYSMLLITLEITLADSRKKMDQYGRPDAQGDVDQVTKRLKAVRSSYEGLALALLEQELKRGMESETNALCSLVRVFRYLDVWPHFVAVYLAVCVDPGLRTVSDNEISSSSVSSSSFTTQVARLQRELQSHTVPTLGYICGFAEPQERVKLAEPLLRRVLGHLDELCAGGASNPAFPTSFATNYKACTALLGWLAERTGLCGTQVALERLSAHLARWPVEVYFHVIARQAILEFEARPTATNLEARLALLQESALPAVSHRVFKLACQLIARYRMALRVGRDATVSSSSLSPSLGAATATAAQALATIEEISRVEDMLDSQIWLRQFSTLDCRFGSEKAQLLDTIVEDLTGAALGYLGLTKSISSQYRGTSRPAPTERSEFIPLAFRPLIEFHEANSVRLAPQMWSQVIARSVAHVVGEYHAVMAELLGMLQKTEASIRRLRTKKASNKGSSQQMVEARATDEEMIRQQCLLDARGLAEELTRVPGFNREDADKALAPTIELVQKHSGRAP